MTLGWVFFLNFRKKGIYDIFFGNNQITFLMCPIKECDCFQKLFFMPNETLYFHNSLRYISTNGKKFRKANLNTQPFMIMCRIDKERWMQFMDKTSLRSRHIRVIKASSFGGTLHIYLFKEEQYILTFHITWCSINSWWTTRLLKNKKRYTSWHPLWVTR